MPMVQTHSRNKRSVARKQTRRKGGKSNSGDDSPFPEYIEQKDGLYRCILCKRYTLDRYMWLNRPGMTQHHKRGTRHKQAVRAWLKAKAKGAELSTYQQESDETSTSDTMETQEDDEERDELDEDSVEMEEPEPEPEPELELEPEPVPEPIVEEPSTPTLYYPSTSWDEPVNQGVRVVLDDPQAIDPEPDVQEPLSAPEVRKSAPKWDRSSQGCVYGSTKTNGYYTCIWCNLPDMPQRKFRRCKRAMRALQEKPRRVVDNDLEGGYPDVDPPPYQLLYPSY